MLVRNATLADGRVRDVRVVGEQVTAVEEGLEGRADETVLDASDRLLLPGMVDVHVHFRQPGFAHKETWASGSRSAAAGGVTTVVDQPNTDPPTVTGEAFDRKLCLAKDALVDFGLNGGVVPSWDPDALLACPLFALGEVFLADSTGNMGIDEDLFSDALHRATAADVPVTVHAEDATLFDTTVKGGASSATAWSDYRPAEAEIAAVERACELADAAGASLHFAHVSTPEAVDVLADYGMTCEVTPHHLLLSRDDLPRLGTFGRMNPPLRSEERRLALYDRVRDGTVDMIATDHAPHTREEKDKSIWEAPSGVPGVETALPLLLAEAEAGHLSLERIPDLTASTPCDRFGCPRKGRVEPGRDADLVLVDPTSKRSIHGRDLHGKSDWTPFEEMPGVFPQVTMVRGTVVSRRVDDGLQFGPAEGTNVRAGD